MSTTVAAVTAATCTECTQWSTEP